MLIQISKPIPLLWMHHFYKNPKSLSHSILYRCVCRQNTILTVKPNIDIETILQIFILLSLTTDFRAIAVVSRAFCVCIWKYRCCNTLLLIFFSFGSISINKSKQLASAFQIPSQALGSHTQFYCHFWSAVKKVSILFLFFFCFI